MSDDTSWECKYCLKPFRRESAFMRHRCPEMERAEKLKTKEGMAAYSYYTEWLKQKGKKAPSIETFASSRYFNSFVKFDEYVRKYKIPKPNNFIKLMINHGDLSPMLWCRDESYSIYLSWYDKTVPPLEQAESTVRNLMRLVEQHDLQDVSEILNKLHHRELMELVRLRKVSPWILLCSKQFKSIMSEMPQDERVLFGDVMGLQYYAEKFAKEPETVEQMKTIAEAMGI